MTPLEKVLDATRNGPQEQQSDGSWMITCPAHEDNNPSLHVTADHNGKLALHCFKSCAVPQICHAMAMTVSELFPDYGKKQPDNPNGSRRKKSKFYDKIKGMNKVAEYDYHDSEGVPIYQVVRYEDPNPSSNKKTFIQRRPNGKNGWTMNMNGIQRVLYHLPELITAPKDQIIFVLEGEKKTDNLRRWNLIATCNVGGAGKWLKYYSKYFRGRRVVILPDNDPTDPKTGVCPGMDHARHVHQSLQGVAERVMI